MPATYYLTTFNTTTVDLCLSISTSFNLATCSALTSAISYCLTEVISVCTECIPSFFLNSSLQCRSCSANPNCLTCDRFNCKQCQPDHYLAVDLSLNTIDSFFTSATVSQSVTSQCLPCSISGCLYCRNYYTDNNINKILCD